MVGTPRSYRMAATVERSTPPDIATATGAVAGMVAQRSTSNCAVGIMDVLVSARSDLWLPCRNGSARGEGANALDNGGDHRNCVVDFCGRSRAAETEAKARARIIAGEACGEQHVRWLRGPGRARRSCGAGDTLQIERNQQRFAARAWERNVRRVRDTMGASAIHAR